MKSLTPRLLCFVLFLVIAVVVLSHVVSSFASAPSSARSRSAHVVPASPASPAASIARQVSSAAPTIQLDSRLPVQTVSGQGNFTNLNATFGSRFEFVVHPGAASVSSGTDGVFHDNTASYVVGVTPAGQSQNFLFHMGTLNVAQGDTYVSNERWTQGLDTTRWQGDTPSSYGLHLTVDFIDPFLGEPTCVAVSVCAEAIKDDTLPVLLVGVSIQNSSTTTQTGSFLFGSNRPLAASNACTVSTPAGAEIHLLSSASSADASGGTLFLAGKQRWACNTSRSDRAGLAWNYQVPAGQSQTAYLVLGGWNASQHLFANSQLASGCQNEGLYAAQEWSSEQAVASFALDNLSAGDNLLGRAQSMENLLLNNTVLTAEQRWLLGDTLRSYKASSWLLGRQACAGGGIDAAVYEGSYGLLSTVDVLHEYGYFEIRRVPWFFKAALSVVLRNASSDSLGTYFQHDQGGDVNSSGGCTTPGSGTPTIRATCYAPPYVSSGVPMPTEENSDVALLLGYYAFVTHDTAFVQAHLNLLDAAMQHNQAVGDPNTGIAYNNQDTTTTYDAASDCLHNDMTGAGNQYYQGLKEATAYRAAAYLDGLVTGDMHGSIWTQAATKIEGAMVQEYNQNGFLPIASSTAFTNCSGRTITLGEGLFYAHLMGLDSNMNSTLLHDLASQYPADLSASTLSSPSMIVLTSSSATGSQCATGHCHRYEWFSKVMLSGIVADQVYMHNGCTRCARLNVVDAAYAYNLNFASNFGDGFHDDGSDWGGHVYPRGIISWAYLL